MKQLYFTVTNDLSYDQRMHRICTSLANSGFNVTLVGRKLRHSRPLEKKSFRQQRLRCFFNKGFLFYSEYNVRLFFFLLNKKMDGICAIDLDTILPCLFVSKIKKIPRIYDAHEFFTELKEVHSRPVIKKIWTAIERYTVPKFSYGYTVSEGIADEFEKRYKRRFLVIRNLPALKTLTPSPKSDFLLYQGAVNEGRGFEYLIPAMKLVNAKLVVCGDGNFMEQLKKLIRKYQVQEKVELKGMLLPEELSPVAQKARLGMSLAEKEGLNQFFALPNKFFDYMHAGLPQITMNFPEYQKINREFPVAILIDDLDPEKLAGVINTALQDKDHLKQLSGNCLMAREKFSWQEEEKKLVNYYQQIFSIE